MEVRLFLKLIHLLLVISGFHCFNANSAEQGNIVNITFVMLIHEKTVHFVVKKSFITLQIYFNRQYPFISSKATV